MFTNNTSLQSDLNDIFIWVHDYQDACVDKVQTFLSGERSPLDKIPHSSSQGSLFSDIPRRGSRDLLSEPPRRGSKEALS
ncbi:hypothetical protein KUTeg_009797 [Tegillarca granosa]|uniref:Uncharacterized protein n=1 Tax=Tegillarca granosa TaxID=220873 RepID=A0ABQ9F4W9_TEGGR|nr:hypothetical protein KUTeg_009797 [Tegillarca granosa]